MKRLVSLAILLAGFFFAVYAQEPAKKVRPMDNEAVQFALSMGIGWNLGNNFDAHYDCESGETRWGNKEVTEQTFKALRKAGFRSVRIPITWMGHMGPAPTYTIEQGWLDRIAEVVGWAKKADLKVIINIHHDGFGADDTPSKGCHWINLPAAVASEEVNSRTKQQLTMVWLQIGKRFAAEGDYLIFETLNEIQDGNWGNLEKMERAEDQFRILNEWNQVCVNAIRAAGGQNETRYIGVPGYVTNPDLTVNNLVLPQDVVEGRLMVAVHSYDPWDFAGSAAHGEWGHTGKDVAPGSTEQEYVGMLNRLYNMYVRRGVPVYFGEFGAVRRTNAADEPFRLYYFRYVCKAMRDRRIPALYWDNGTAKMGADGFGVIDHHTGRYISNGEEIVRAMVDAWEGTDGFTLQQIYESAPTSSRK